MVHRVPKPSEHQASVTTQMQIKVKRKTMFLQRMVLFMRARCDDSSGNKASGAKRERIAERKSPFLDRTFSSFLWRKKKETPVWMTMMAIGQIAL